MPGFDRRLSVDSIHRHRIFQALILCKSGKFPSGRTIVGMSLFSRNKKSREQKAYEAKLKEAQDAQRNGKIQEYADLMVEAETLLEKVREAE